MTDINPPSIAIAVASYYPTWYRGKLKGIKNTDKIRGDLALEFVGKAKEKGFRLVVSDGGSSKTFKQELSRINGIKVLKRKSPKRSPAKRQAIKACSQIEGVKVIVLTEPEKVSLIEDCLDDLVKPILENKADIVIPKRNFKLFELSYPNYMVESEKQGNFLYNQMLRESGLLNRGAEDLDLFFGPRLFKNNSSITSLFMKKFKFNIKGISDQGFFDVEEYSDASYFPIVLAFRKKLKVLSITVPFTYPKIQKENEDKGDKKKFLEKRKLQRQSLLIELMLFIDYLKDKRLL